MSSTNVVQPENVPEKENQPSPRGEAKASPQHPVWGFRRTDTVGKSGLAIRLSNVQGLGDKWVRLLQQADRNGDGVVDAAEVVHVMEKMLREQSLHRLYRFMTLMLLLMTMVLIGAMSGITFRIVEMTKDTKVSTYTNSTYQFLLTKDGLAAVTGVASLDMSALHLRTEGPSRRSMLAGGAAGTGGERRVTAEFNPADWVYAGTIPYMTVEMGCSLLSQNIVQFPVSMPSNRVFVDGSAYRNVKVLHQTGCDKGDVNKVSALVRSEAWLYYWVYCDASIQGCDLWAYLPAAIGSGGRRRLLQNNPKIRPVLGSSETIDIPEELQDAELPEGMTVEEAIALILSGQCFPADATVDVHGKGPVRMDELQYGDLVRSYDRSTGALIHRAVYVFGHRQKHGLNRYIHITAGAHTLAASQMHFVPVCVARCTAAELSAGSAVMENRRAGDIRVGDTLLTAAPNPELMAVTRVETFLAQGAFVPYVRGADLIVDGVVASPHTVWLLDAIAPAWMVPYLPYIYEVMLAPVYGLYCIVGPATIEWLAHGLRLADLGGADSYGGGYFVFLAGLAAPLVAAAQLTRAASRRLLRR